MGNHLFRGGIGAGALLAVGGTAAALALPASSGAAPVVPLSQTTCHGKLSADAKGAAKGDPNLVDYSFSCDGAITAYTIIAHQNKDPQGSLDDFLAAPSVLETDNLTPSPTETITCEGVVPSNGINCNTGAKDAQLTLGYYVDGAIDPVQTYCKHLPVAADGSTVTTPGLRAIPTARVQLVVTDSTGAEDGPFALHLDKACPSVPNKGPAPTTTTKTKARHLTRRAG